LIFESYFWVNASKGRDLRVVRSNVRFRIDELFEQHNIVIAFPQRDIHVDGKLQLVPNVSYASNTQEN
jgi:small-conductance mechanosensitive channel